MTGLSKEVKEKWDYYVELINTALDIFLPCEKEEPTELYKAIRYAVFSGGKRLRPTLSLATAEAFGADPKAILPQAAAIEMIHTFTLVHDDLPDIDNDDFRRGKPTVHKVFGNDIAILAGDALFACAFKTALRGSLSDDKKIKILKEITNALCYKGVIEGQVADIKSTKRKSTYEDMIFIHTHKTGKLIECSVMVGVIGADAPLEVHGYMRKFGQNLGLAFQIKDDLLDAFGDEEKVGKKLRKDYNKASAAAILGKEKAEKMMRELIDEAKKNLRKAVGDNGKFLEELAEYIITREE
ncbi:MAG: polyprenyl synthetase family protein [candidate division WOR-3 bacterium]